MINPRIRNKINPDEFVYADTGETMRSLLGNVDIVSAPNKEKIDYRSKEFFIVDSQALRNASVFLRA